MCGIVGFVGKQSAAPILLKGLQQLEYRGYDSAGIAVMDAGTICVPFRWQDRLRCKKVSLTKENGEGMPPLHVQSMQKWELI